ncbi:hypothetical protein V6N12_027401 [Hibiscus sabdariffa]|uniref:Uncharacterized protein n=1 Tax=Hibiscus sabdariffa TaxID=183260 RepID=A0ABR2DUL3_9ROSI
MEVNSESYWIKVTTTTYENEKHWIDEGSPEISHDGIDSYHFEDLDIRMDEKENDTISNKELNGFNKVSCEDKHVRKHQARLVDVPLTQASESLNSSSGLSEPTSPTFDKKYGLFTIKTRSFKIQRNKSLGEGKANLDKLRFWASWNRHSGPLKLSYNEQNGEALGHHESSEKTNPPKSYTTSKCKNSDPREKRVFDEATLALKVCNAVGLHFLATDSEVRKRFAEIENDARLD